MIRTNLPTSSGIYIIYSIVNGKRYVGSAVNLKYRRNCHFRELEKRIHHNKYLQRHYNKYGKDDLKFGVIEFCPPEKLIEREQYWIDSFHLFSETGNSLGFNILPKAGSVLGLRWSEEAKIYRSKIQIGKQPGLGYHRILTKEQKQEIKERMLRFWASEKGTKLKSRFSKERSGENGVCFGKHFNHTKRTKQIMRIKKLGKKQCKENIEQRKISMIGKNVGQIRDVIFCPWCGISGKVNVISRFHFDNCKMNPNYILKENRLLIRCPHCGCESRNKGIMDLCHFDNCKHRLKIVS